MTIFMFSRARNPLLTLFLSYCVWVTSKIQVIFRFKRFSEVLMILSYKFSQFLQYLCFWGPGNHCWNSYSATMFGRSRKSRSTCGTRGTLMYWWLSLIDFWICFHYLFFRSRNPLPTFLLSYHVWVTSKIQVNFRFKRFSEVLMILFHEFSQFLQYICFGGQGFHCWHSYWAIMFGWPRKSRST